MLPSRDSGCKVTNNSLNCEIFMRKIERLSANKLSLQIINSKKTILYYEKKPLLLFCMCMTCTIYTYAQADAKTEIYEPLIKSEAGFVTYEGSLKIAGDKKGVCGLYTKDGKTCIINRVIYAYEICILPGTETLVNGSCYGDGSVNKAYIPNTVKSLSPEAFPTHVRVIVYDPADVTDLKIIELNK